MLNVWTLTSGHKFNMCLYWYWYCSCSLPDFMIDIHVCMPRIFLSYKICRYSIYVIAEHTDTVLSEVPSTNFADRAKSVANNFSCVDSNVTYPWTSICLIQRSSRPCYIHVFSSNVLGISMQIEYQKYCSINFYLVTPIIDHIPLINRNVKPMIDLGMCNRFLIVWIRWGTTQVNQVPL